MVEKMTNHNSPLILIRETKKQLLIGLIWFPLLRSQHDKEISTPQWTHSHDTIIMISNN